MRPNHIYGVLRTDKYLFGVYGEEWSDIIATLFAAKLDQLFIENEDNAKYMPIEQMDALREVHMCNRIS